MFAIQVLVSVDIQAEILDGYAIKIVSLFSDVLLEDFVFLHAFLAVYLGVLE